MTFTSRDISGGEPWPLSITELEALKRICNKLPGWPVIIQIGSGIGCSTMAMLEERPGATLFSIDNKCNDAELQNLKRAGLSYQNVIRIWGNSQDVGVAWVHSCDLLFIDGDHQRPGIDEDIKLFVPHVKRGGYVLFHDYIPPLQRPAHIHSQVYEAIEEWLEQERELFGRIFWVDRLVCFTKVGK